MPNQINNKKSRNRLLTPRQAEIELGIPRVKIYAWIRNRKFKFYKPKKEILFWKSDLLNWLEGHSVITHEEVFKDIEI